MKLIKRDADYAIRAMCFMAKAGGKRIPVTEIVKALGIPRPFMRKILQTLNRRRLVRSYKGKGGGFSVDCKCGNVRLTDVIEAFQGPLKLNECLFKRSVCPNVGTCPLKSRIDKVERRVISELRGITIKELVGKGR